MLMTYMKSILIQLDDGTIADLDRVASPARRQRTEFIRRAIRRAIQQAEFARMERAYREVPDTEPAFEDWSNWEEFKP